MLNDRRNRSYYVNHLCHVATFCQISRSIGLCWDYVYLVPLAAVCKILHPIALHALRPLGSCHIGVTSVILMLG